MSVLADSGVWIEYFGLGEHGAAWQMDEMLQSNLVRMCGPVAEELVAGAPAGKREQLWTLIQGLEWTPFARDQWRQLGEAAAKARESNLRPSVGLLQAAVSALAVDAELWSLDPGAPYLTKILPTLRVRSNDAPKAPEAASSAPAPAAPNFMRAPAAPVGQPAPADSGWVKRTE